MANLADSWPLMVSQHTLAVLVEVLLMRQQQEREAKSVQSTADTIIMSIWSRFLNSLKSAIMVFDNRSEQFEGKEVVAWNAGSLWHH